MSSSVGMIIPNLMEKSSIHVPNHQSDYDSPVISATYLTAPTVDVHPSNR